MTEFARIVIGESAIPSLAVTVLLMIALPVAACILWRARHRERTGISWLIAGAVGFLVSARVLELGVHYLCVLADNPVSRFINGNTAAFVLYGAAMAGVFEEGGRQITLKYILKKHRTRENAVLYGIGHGGIEILAVVLPTMILSLVSAVLFSQGTAADAMQALNITEETAGAALPAVQAAAAFDYGMMALNVMERLLAMLVHIGLTVIVFDGVVRGRKAALPLAILLHMLTDAFPALYQRGVVPLWSVEVWLACWTAVVGFMALRRYRKLGVLPSEGSAPETAAR